jgi:uncharacterized protein
LVVDFHTHVGHRRFWNPKIVAEFTKLSPSFVESMETLMTPKNLIDFFKGQGIDYAVCIADNSAVTGCVPNDFVLDFCEGHPELIPFFSVNPHDPDITEIMVRYVQRHRIGGFKFFPTYQYFYPNDRQLYTFYEFLQSAGKVVMFHTGTSNFPGAKTLYGDPIYIEEVAVDFPQLKVVMAHSGRPFWYDKAFHLSILHENLYMDLAGVPPQHLMSYFPKLESNADRILVGTDFPAQPKPLRSLIGIIEGLPLRPVSIEKILGENARRVLGL